jgi:hypothetical protein
LSTLNDCFVDLSGWCASKRLQLNASKTEVLLSETVTNLQKILLDCGIMHAGSIVIKLADIVRDRRVMTDAQLTMHEHMARISCSFHLC